MNITGVNTRKSSYIGFHRTNSVTAFNLRIMPIYFLVELLFILTWTSLLKVIMLFVQGYIVLLVSIDSLHMTSQIT